MSTQLTRLRRLATSARVRAALSLGVVTAIGATGTFAYWTDNVVVGGTTFTSGSIDLRVNGDNQISQYTALNLSNMVPGNSAAATLNVANVGTAALKYTVASSLSSGSSALGEALVVKVVKGGTVAGSGSAKTCTGTALVETALVGTGGATKALISTGQLLTATGSPGAADTLCVQVTLPSSVTNNNLQGQTSVVGFTFTGTSDLS